MTDLTTALKRARSVLEKNGWVGPKLEPFSVDATGRTVHFTDEGVHTFSVRDAIASQGVSVREAFELMHRIANPSAARFDDALARQDPAAALSSLAEALTEYWSFESWLEAPYRGVGEVLRLFTLAITRSKKSGERRNG